MFPIRVARTDASPSASITCLNPAAEAHEAVAVPTANTGSSWQDPGQAGIALRLVTTVAAIRPGSRRPAPELIIASTGAITGMKPIAVIRSAVREASGSGLVISIRFTRLAFVKIRPSVSQGAVVTRVLPASPWAKKTGCHGGATWAKTTPAASGAA